MPGRRPRSRRPRRIVECRGDGRVEPPSPERRSVARPRRRRLRSWLAKVSTSSSVGDARAMRVAHREAGVATSPLAHTRIRATTRESVPTSRRADGLTCGAHVLRRVQAPAARHRSRRNRRLARFARPGGGPGGPDARPVPHLQAAQAGAPAPGRAAAADPDPLHQHDQPRAGAVLPGRRGDGAADPAPDPLERRRDGPARQQPVLRDRRPPRHLRLGRDPLRGRLQPLLPGQGRRRERRPDLLPGPRRARASTPGPSWRAGSARTSSTISGARRCPARA